MWLQNFLSILASDCHMLVTHYRAPTRTDLHLKAEQASDHFRKQLDQNRTKSGQISDLPVSCLNRLQTFAPPEELCEWKVFTARSTSFCAQQSNQRLFDGVSRPLFGCFPTVSLGCFIAPSRPIEPTDHREVLAKPKERWPI